MVFGWGKAKPPLTASRRAQIELRLRNLLGLFPAPEIRGREVITDVGQLLQGPEGELPSLRATTDRLAQLFDVSPDGITPEAAGGCGTSCGCGPSTSVDEEHKVVASLATQLSALRLTKEVQPGGAINCQDPWYAELAAFCFGLGPVMANRPLRQLSKENSSYTQSGRFIGILTPEDMGFALAMLCRMTGDDGANWVNSLRREAKNVFSASMKTMGSPQTMVIDATSVPNANSPLDELLQHVTSSNPTFQYLASEVLAERTESRKQFVQPLCSLLKVKDELQTVTAAACLGSMGEDAIDAKAALESLLSHRVDAIAGTAMMSLLAIDTNPIAFESFGETMEDRWSMVLPLASALASYGHDAEPAAPSVCRCLLQAMRRADDNTIEALAACLGAIHTDPMEILRDTVNSPELHDWVMQHLSSLESVEEDSKAIAAATSLPIVGDQ
ncbi:MAG: hypothetical protein AAGG44_08905 [Planctomycetota bacterium]